MAEAAAAVETAKTVQPSLGSIFDSTPRDDSPKETEVAKATPQEEKSAEVVKEAPSKASPAAEAKSEEKPPLEAAKEEAKPKEEVKAVVEEKSKEKEPSQAKSNWDTDENPYRKRWKDAGDYANRVNRENLEIKKQLEIVNKKLDGTYDPEKAEPKAPPQEEILATGQALGRVGASLDAAYQIYGKEIVDKEVDEFNQLFEENPIVQQRVKGSNMPVVEAIKVMEEYRFIKENGPDPKKWKENIRKALVEELTPIIREEESQKLMARLDKKENEVAGIGGARGSSGMREEKPAAAAPTLSSLFGS